MLQAQAHDPKHALFSRAAELNEHWTLPSTVPHFPSTVLTPPAECPIRQSRRPLSHDCQQHSAARPTEPLRTIDMHKQAAARTAQCMPKRPGRGDRATPGDRITQSAPPYNPLLSLPGEARGYRAPPGATRGASTPENHPR
eukprot:CAMPEP_0180196634 /NCGR_PEP_ID=MMETSP0987-20121128/4214_1 /TAXON_ID=697907 /ORGANISM="non described non described, Strain CCMP2293" /LENGTH=140 /DNA_ID=CAMNT_0022151533 /DNA_START=62 /DNA_END=481 /DNA_ORIENTATION=-